MCHCAYLKEPRLDIDYAKAFTQAEWCDVLPRSAVRPALSSRVLLHAGPPFRGPPPAPVANSAFQALIFEGLAADVCAGRDLLLHGDIELKPAQDYGIVTPLAQVVSASMLLVAVAQRGHVGYAPIVEGAAPALRFGCAAADCLQRLRHVGAVVAGVVAPVVRRRPLAMDGVIRAAVAAGDECHARTAAAHAALLSRLHGVDDAAAASLRENPAFVLTLLMAAAAAALRSHRCDIEAIGGNGIDFGIRRHGETIWRQVPAEAPKGLRLGGFETRAALPAIGDSAVIDYCGLGGQALSAAPLLRADWNGMLPTDALSRRQDLIDPQSGIVDAVRVVNGRVAPLINLAIIDRDGSAGLLGRGFYSPPIELFSPSRES